MTGKARRIWLAFAFGLPVGCANLKERERSTSPVIALRPDEPAIRQAAYTQEPQATPKSNPTTASTTPFAGDAELTADAVVAQVLARNPTLAQMVSAHHAASARYPQVTSLDDPMVGVSTAPGAWGSNQVNGGYRLDISQKLPFPGKRDLRGTNALAEARAAGNDVEDARLQLTESAAAAFFDYYLVERSLDVNRESLRLLVEFKQTAETLYKTGKAPQQDVLQADVEMGRQRERRLTLERVREVAIARINTLMHLPPDAALPPPPKRTRSAIELPESLTLRDMALTNRPDLKALDDRIAAEQAALQLARKDFGPDVELMGAYDTFWQENPLRVQAGLRVNLPVRLPKRYAAIAEAQAKVAQRQAELARLTDQVNYQVQEAAAQLRESGQIVRLYEGEILPAANLNVKSARTAYTNGQIPFVTLIEAQRSAVELQDRYFDATAAYGRRRAVLERVLGGPLDLNPMNAPIVPKMVSPVVEPASFSSPMASTPPASTPARSLQPTEVETKWHPVNR